MPASNFAGSAGSLEKNKREKMEKTGLLYRGGVHPEGLSNRVTFISTETFREGRREPFGCLERESQGSGSSRNKVPKAGVCSTHEGQQGGPSQGSRVNEREGSQGTRLRSRQGPSPVRPWKPLW